MPREFLHSRNVYQRIRIHFIKDRSYVYSRGEEIMLYCSIISKRGEMHEIGRIWLVESESLGQILDSGNVYLDRSIRELDLFKNFSLPIDTFHAIDHAISDYVVYPSSLYENTCRYKSVIKRSSFDRATIYIRCKDPLKSVPAFSRLNFSRATGSENNFPSDWDISTNRSIGNRCAREGGRYETRGQFLFH